MQSLRIFLIRILLLLIPISGCSKRTVELETTNTKVGIKLSADSSASLKLQTSWTKNTHSYLVRTDDYDVEIVPDGEFNFNSKTGFTGKAKSIRIKGKSMATQNISNQESSKKDSTASIRVKKNADIKASAGTKSKQTKSVSTWPFSMIAVLVLVLAILTLLFKSKSIIVRYISKILSK